MMGGFGFGDFSRQAQRLAAAAQQARYNNEVRKPSSFTCLHLHIEWQLSEALQQILRSPTALAVLLVEHAYSSLFFDSILARHVAGARRNGPTRFGFGSPPLLLPALSHSDTLLSHSVSPPLPTSTSQAPSSLQGPLSFPLGVLPSSASIFCVRSQSPARIVRVFPLLHL